jgi:hypothetical protein
MRAPTMYVCVTERLPVAQLGADSQCKPTCVVWFPPGCRPFVLGSRPCRRQGTKGRPRDGSPGGCTTHGCMARVGGRAHRGGVRRSARPYRPAGRGWRAHCRPVGRQPRQRGGLAGAGARAHPRGRGLQSVCTLDGPGAQRRGPVQGPRGIPGSCSTAVQRTPHTSTGAPSGTSSWGWGWGWVGPRGPPSVSIHVVFPSFLR